MAEGVGVHPGVLLRDAQPDTLCLVSPAMRDADHTGLHLIADGDGDPDAAHSRCNPGHVGFKQLT